MPAPMISYQLYSSRNFPTLERQLKMLQKIGFQHVEPFGGLFADVPALRDGLAKNGLTAPSAHLGIQSLRDDFPGTMTRVKSLGIDLAIIPAVPPAERVQDRAGWEALGRELAEYARRAADLGLRFAWHNHHFEFARLPDGAMPLDLILGTEEKLLWQVDIAWAIRGGQDPVEWINRYAPRVASFHVKDLAPEGENAVEDGWEDVGYGRLDWTALLAAMRATPATIYTLEHDNPTDDERFAKRSFATVKGW